MTSIARTIISQASLEMDGGDIGMELERCYPAPGRSRPHIRRDSLVPSGWELGIPLRPRCFFEDLENYFAGDLA